MPSFLKTYGPALGILVVVGVWMGSGTIVEGGQGPGKGEKPVVGLIDGGDGPLSKAVEKAGLTLKPGSTELDEPDPHLTIAQRNAEQSAAEGELRSVRIKSFVARPMPLEVTLRGRTAAKESVAMLAQTSAVVTKMSVEKGDLVKKGDLLCTLDPGTRPATVAQADAALAQAQLAYDTNKSLREKGFASTNSEAQLEAALKSAQAALDNAKLDLEHTKIYAKIGGVVQEPMADVGGLLSAGGTCATIVDLNPILFVGSVPEARINMARLGLPVEITTVAGDKATGKVTYVSSTANSDTQTFQVEAEIPNPGNTIRDGLTTEAKVNAGTVPAQLLPQSVLTLNDEGTLGVRAVENDIVKFYPVTIVKDAADGAWVTGLPAKVDVITLGQENVKAGQKVDAKPFEDKALDNDTSDSTAQDGKGDA